MKPTLFFLLIALSFSAYAQDKDQDKDKKPAPTLKSILLEQLRTTHNQKEWFVDANTAVEGLTPEQASWTDGKGNHSVGQLANHLIFWDSEELAKFKGEPPPKFSGNNDETFNNFDSKNWPATVKQLDQVLTDWEKAVEAADETKLKDWYSIIAHVGAHNAYHIGQIIYVRKEQGSWNPEKGVK
jgi:uncharacterized damage-inducible protein DinB